jgi:hypothetical protein
MTAPLLVDDIFRRYQKSFRERVAATGEGGHDPLMDVFGIKPEQKAGEAQFWGRELGMCWERLVIGCFASHPRYRPGVTRGREQLCDLVVGHDAIDTKYRVGSGDAGTLGKIVAHGAALSAQGLEPMLLVFRDDSLAAARSRLSKGGWRLIEGAAALDWVRENSGVDLVALLRARRHRFAIS